MFEGRIEQIDVTGKVSPGDTVGVHPALTNTGSVPSLGFIKLTYPVYTPAVVVLPLRYILGPSMMGGNP